jgi:hypothetical protein
VSIIAPVEDHGMGSVVMETDEGIITDYGLWDRTFMEVDLLDTDVRI